MPALNDNPFAVLTAVVAPAILTNACSVLSLGTGNRIARVVDRTRVLTVEIASLAAGSPQYESRIRQFGRLRERARLLLRALRIFYAALGSFAAGALIAVIGSALAFYEQRLAFHIAAAVGLATGAFAVIGLVAGCVLMVHETRLAVMNITEEMEIAPGPRQGER